MLIKIFPLILPLALSLVENNFHRLISFFTFQAHHFILQTTTHICMMAYMNLDMETHSNNAMLEKNGLKTRVKKYQGMNFKNYLTFCQIFWFNFKFLNNFHKNDLFEVLFFSRKSHMRTYRVLWFVSTFLMIIIYRNWTHKKKRARVKNTCDLSSNERSRVDKKPREKIYMRISTERESGWWLKRTQQF